MPVETKTTILTRHPYFRLRLAHAAIGNYPCHAIRNTMPVNRFFIVFADSGKDDSWISDALSGEKFPIRAGHFYFVPCNHPSDWHLEPDVWFVSLQFNLELFYGFDVFRDYRHCLMQNAPDLAQELKELIHHEDEIRTLCRINEIIYNLCVQLLSDQTVKLQKNIVQWHNYEKIFEFIQNHGDATTTVAMLAEMHGQRNNVFSRNFTSDIGITPKDFISNTLTRKASDMLLTPGVTILEIARKLNFSSEYYFSRFFKRQTGVPPRQFRQMNGSQ